MLVLDIKKNNSRNEKESIIIVSLFYNKKDIYSIHFNLYGQDSLNEVVVYDRLNSSIYKHKIDYEKFCNDEYDFLEIVAKQLKSSHYDVVSTTSKNIFNEIMIIVNQMQKHLNRNLDVGTILNSLYTYHDSIEYKFFVSYKNSVYKEGLYINEYNYSKNCEEKSVNYIYHSENNNYGKCLDTDIVRLFTIKDLRNIISAENNSFNVDYLEILYNIEERESKTFIQEKINDLLLVI